MPFDSKIDNITAESQHIVDEFLGYYTFPNSYGGMIKKIQKKLNITDFKKLTWVKPDRDKNRYVSAGA